MSRLRRLEAALLCAALALAAPALWAAPANLAGSVIGVGARPIAGARVEVLGAGGAVCATTTAADGTFALSCAVTGPHAVRASSGDLRPWQHDAIELGPDRDVHLNFMLLPAAAGAPPAAEAPGFFTRRLPNPAVAPGLSLRALAIIVAAACFVLGALTMFALGRQFGIDTRRLAPGEVADLVLNPARPAVGERVSPVAAVGATGASATISYDADKIAAALAAGRHGLVFVALVVAPGLFALAALGFMLAVLIGQETYLFVGALLVPAGFLLTPIVIGVQALRRRRAS
jgi:hypothetical protein